MNWIAAHPFALLAFSWVMAAVISTMPALPAGTGFFGTWIYHVMQFIGANMDKMPHSMQMQNVTSLDKMPHGESPLTWAAAQQWASETQTTTTAAATPVKP